MDSLLASASEYVCLEPTAYEYACLREFESCDVNADGIKFRIGPDQYNDLFQCIASMSSLQDFQIIGNTPWNIHEIPFHLICSCPRLVSVSLNNVAIRPYQLETLLAGNQNLEKLIFRSVRPLDATWDEPLDATWDELLRGLARGLKRNSSLKELQFPCITRTEKEKCGTMPTDFTAMVDTFATPPEEEEEDESQHNLSTLETLVCGKRVDALSLFSLLKLNPFPNLLTLNVNLRYFFPDDLVEALQSVPSLKRVTITDHTSGYLTCDVVVALLGMVWTGKKLSYRLHDCISVDDARYLLSQLESETLIEDEMEFSLDIKIHNGVECQKPDLLLYNCFQADIGRICLNHLERRMENRIQHHLFAMDIDNLRLENLPLELDQLRCPRQHQESFYAKYTANYLFRMLKENPALVENGNPSVDDDDDDDSESVDELTDSEPVDDELTDGNPVAGESNNNSNNSSMLDGTGQRVSVSPVDEDDSDPTELQAAVDSNEPL